MARTQPETRIQRAIQHTLTNEFHCKVVKIHGDAETERGTPDLIASWAGRCLVLEVKVPGADPDPIQVLRLNEWQDAGALVGCVHSVEETVLVLLGRQIWDRFGNIKSSQ